LKGLIWKNYQLNWRLRKKELWKSIVSRYCIFQLFKGGLKISFQGRVYEKGIIDKGYEKEVLEKGYQKGFVTEMRKNIRTYQRAIKTI